MDVIVPAIAPQDPAVFELANRKSVRQHVELRLPAALQRTTPAIRIEPATTPQGFHFHAGDHHWRDDPAHPGLVHLHVEVTCRGGAPGAEDGARLTVTFPGGETASVRLIASADHVAPFSEALREEYRELRPDWEPLLTGGIRSGEPPGGEDGAAADPDFHDDEDAALRKLYQAAHADPDGLAALCFSGGGIRSATFNLGVLQAFAHLGLLDRFHYLSTVSGGGYIGSWLSGWLQREDPATVLRGMAGAEPTVTRPEAGPIRHLRQYSNYLTPKLGALSADSWTLVAIVLRNLLLNWLVIVPILAALLAVPLLAIAELPGYARWPNDVIFGAAFLLGVVGLGFMSLLRASRPEDGPGETGRRWEQWFLPLGLGPLLAGTACLVFAVPLFSADGTFTFGDVLVRSALWGLVMPLAALLLSAAAHPLVFPGRPRRSSLRVDIVAVLLSGAVVTAVYAGMLAKWAPALLQPELRPLRLYEILAPALVLLPLLLGKTLFIAFASPAEGWWKERLSEHGDADREWWARWSAWVLIAAVVWVLASGLVFLAPLLLATAAAKIGTAAGAGGLGGLTSRLGKSAKSGGGPDAAPAGWRKWVLALAPPLFCLLLLLLISAGTQGLLRRLFDRPTVNPIDTVVPDVPDTSPAAAAAAPEPPSWLRTAAGQHPPFQGPFLVVLGTIAVLFGLGNAMGYFVNVNRFSLQGMYRNRLVRAYLGASNARRSPNPFTGFDPHDNLRVHQLRRNRPFHVVNMTLNLVAGKDLAWQQRKATGFTATPLYCGSSGLGFRRSQVYGGRNGVSFGTVVATSGAAANPNMGLYSSAPVTFIMTLFNARLGIWLGNPGKVGRTTFERNGPRISSRVIFEEAVGMTDADHPYVNLSDGGHFENLGLYEMVRRRCRFIVVSDAGGDPQCEFQDLGNAIRKIRIDLGIPISFEHGVQIYPKPQDQPKEEARYCAIGTIHYPDVDGPGAKTGTLIYLKPAICRQEPYDVYNYSKSSADFPHETTADQWFSESQFESYRALGRSALLTMAGRDGRPADFAAFTARVAKYIAGAEAPTSLLARAVEGLDKVLHPTRQIEDPDCGAPGTQPAD